MFGVLKSVKNQLTSKCVGVTFCLLLLMSAAFAATTTSTFTVQITITTSCTIVSTTTLNFGATHIAARCALELREPLLYL